MAKDTQSEKADGRYTVDLATLMAAGQAVVLDLAARYEATTDAHLRAAVERIARLFGVQSRPLRELVQRAATPSLPNDADSSLTEPMPAAPPAVHMFRRRGQVWQVQFAGSAEFFLLPCKGAAYLHILLSNPRKDFSVVDLVYEVAKAPQKYALGSAGEGLDKDALAAYRERYRSLTEEMATANANNDEARRDRIRAEMKWLAEHVNRDLGLGGRLRKQADDRERLRKAFRAAVRRVVNEVAKHGKALAAHLAPPHLTCGSRPCYHPLDGSEWET